MRGNAHSHAPCKRRSTIYRPSSDSRAAVALGLRHDMRHTTKKTSCIPSILDNYIYFTFSFFHRSSTSLKPHRPIIIPLIPTTLLIRRSKPRGVLQRRASDRVRIRRRRLPGRTDLDFRGRARRDEVCRIDDRWVGHEG